MPACWHRQSEALPALMRPPLLPGRSLSLHELVSMKQAVANTQQAGFKHARSDATVTAHGIVAASAERAFHLAAGMTGAGIFQQGISDTKAFFFERQQVDAGNHDVTSQ